MSTEGDGGGGSGHGAWANRCLRQRRKHRDGVVAAGVRLAVPRRRTARPAPGRTPRRARRTWRAAAGRPAPGTRPRAGRRARGGARRFASTARLGPGRDEDHHVAGEHHDVERAAEVDGREVGEVPRQVRAPSCAAAASSSSSRSTPTTSTPRRASSIATRPVPQPASSTDAGRVRHDERDLAVRIDARRRHAAPTARRTSPASRPLRGPTASAGHSSPVRDVLRRLGGDAARCRAARTPRSRRSCGRSGSRGRRSAGAPGSTSSGGTASRGTRPASCRGCSAAAGAGDPP